MKGEGEESDEDNQGWKRKKREQIKRNNFKVKVVKRADKHLTLVRMETRRDERRDFL